MIEPINHITVLVRITPAEEKLNQLIKETIQSRAKKTNNSIKETTVNLPETDPTSRCIKVFDDFSLQLKQEDLSRDNEKNLQFDRVFTEETSQEDVYEHIKDSITQVTLGVDLSIVTYGAAKSGKTYTMVGQSKQVGIIPRAVKDIFFVIEEMTYFDTNCSFHVEMSYVELYNNSFRNLLKSEVQDHFKRNSGTEKIDIHDSVDFGVFLSSPSARFKVQVQSARETMEHFVLGNRKRSMKALDASGYQSSRGHAVLTLYFEYRSILNDSERSFTDGEDQSENTLEANCCLRVSKLNFVDMAGGGRFSTDLDATCVQELHHISLSLAAFGDCLCALAKAASANTKQPTHPTIPTHSNPTPPRPSVSHVPFMNSKLSYLLKDGLSGLGKMVLIAHVQGERDHTVQTQTTLKYASWAQGYRSLHVQNRNANLRMHDLQAQADWEKDPHVAKLCRLMLQRSKQFHEERLPGGILAVPKAPTETTDISCSTPSLTRSRSGSGWKTPNGKASRSRSGSRSSTPNRTMSRGRLLVPRGETPVKPLSVALNSQELYEMQMRMSVMEAVNERLEEELREKETLVSLLEEKLSSVEESSMLTEKQFLKCSRESAGVHDRLLQELNEKTDRQIKSFSEQVNRLEEAATDDQRSISTMNREIERLKTDLNSLNQDKDTLENEILQKQEEIDSIKKQLNSVKNSQNELLQDLHTTKEDVEEVTKKLWAVEKELEQSKSEVNLKDELLKQLQEELSSVEQDHELQEKEFMEKEEELKTVREFSHKFRTCWELSTEENGSKNVIIAELRSRLSAADECQQLSAAEFEKKKGEMETLQNRMRDLANTKSELEKTLEHETNESKRLQQELIGAKKEVESLKAVEVESEVYIEELKSCKSKLKRTEEALVEAELSSKSRRAELDLAQQTVLDHESSLSRQVEELLQTKKELSAAEQATLDAGEARSQLEEMFKLISAELLEVKRKLSDLQGAWDCREDVDRRVKLELNQMKNELQRSEDSREYLEQELEKRNKQMLLLSIQNFVNRPRETDSCSIGVNTVFQMDITDSFLEERFLSGEDLRGAERPPSTSNTLTSAINTETSQGFRLAAFSPNEGMLDVIEEEKLDDKIPRVQGPTDNTNAERPESRLMCFSNTTEDKISQHSTDVQHSTFNGKSTPPVVDEAHQALKTDADIGKSPISVADALEQQEKIGKIPKPLGLSFDKVSSVEKPEEAHNKVHKWIFIVFSLFVMVLIGFAVSRHFDVPAQTTGTSTQMIDIEATVEDTVYVKKVEPSVEVKGFNQSASSVYYDYYDYQEDLLTSDVCLVSKENDNLTELIGLINKDSRILEQMKNTTMIVTVPKYVIPEFRVASLSRWRRIGGQWGRETICKVTEQMKNEISKRLKYNFKDKEIIPSTVIWWDYVELNKVLMVARAL